MPVFHCFQVTQYVFWQMKARQSFLFFVLNNISAFENVLMKFNTSGWESVPARLKSFIDVSLTDQVVSY